MVTIISSSYMGSQYLFTSSRLGFREWCDSDIDPLAAINADEKVMEFFPSIQSREQTISFIERMQQQFWEKGFCYYAVDTLYDSSFIGFIGISEQTYEADFTPCIDIGWRLKREAWGNGYATEGAKRCLQYAFTDLEIGRILSVAPVANKKSEQVMTKIGMLKVKEFTHPLLAGNQRLEQCVLYKIYRG